MGKIITPIVDLERKLIADAQEQIRVERQVIVHVSISTTHSWWQIRIWPSTFLVPREGADKAKLLNADRIPFFPEWLHVFGSKHHFTLIFEGLSNDCEVFDLIEEIPQEGGFEVKGICRNQTDVYHVEIFD